MSSEAKARGSVFDRLGSKKKKSHSKSDFDKDYEDGTANKGKTKPHKEKNYKETDVSKKEKSKTDKSGDKVKSLIVSNSDNSESSHAKKRKATEHHKEEPVKKKKTKPQNKDRDSSLEATAKPQEKTRDKVVDTDKRPPKSDFYLKEDSPDVNYQKSSHKKSKSAKQLKNRSPKSSSKDISQPPLNKSRVRSSSFNSCISSEPSEYGSAGSEHEASSSKPKSKKDREPSQKSKLSEDKKIYSKKTSKRYESTEPEIKEAKKSKKETKTAKKERYGDQLESSPRSHSRDDQYFDKYKKYSDVSKTKDDSSYSKYDYSDHVLKDNADSKPKRKYEVLKVTDSEDYKNSRHQDEAESSKRKHYDPDDGKSSKYYHDNADDVKQGKYYGENSEEAHQSRKNKEKLGKHSSTDHSKQTKEKIGALKYDYYTSKTEDSRVDRSKKSERRSETNKKDDRSTGSSRDRDKNYKSRNYKKDYDRRSRDRDRRVDDRYEGERDDSIDRKEKNRFVKSNERRSKPSYREGSTERQPYSKISEDGIVNRKDDELDSDKTAEPKAAPLAILLDDLELDEVSDTELDDLPVGNQSESEEANVDTKEVDIDLQTWDSEEETNEELFRLAGEGDPPPRHRGILETLKVPWKSLVEESAVMKESEIKGIHSSLSERFLPSNLLLKYGLSKRFAGIDLYDRAKNLITADSSRLVEHEIPGLHMAKQLNIDRRFSVIRRYAYCSGALSARKDSAIRSVLSDISV